MSIPETVTVDGLRERAKWVREMLVPSDYSKESLARHLELAADLIVQLDNEIARLKAKAVDDTVDVELKALGLSDNSNETVQIIIEGIQDLGLHQRFADYATGRERDSSIDWQARIDALFKEIY